MMFRQQHEALATQGLIHRYHPSVLRGGTVVQLDLGQNHAYVIFV